MPKSKIAAKAVTDQKQPKKLLADKVKKMSKSKTIKKTAPADGGIKKNDGEKKKFRYKAGTIALREVKRYQKSIDNLLPRAPFQRLVRSIVEEMDHQLRF